MKTLLMGNEEFQAERIFKKTDAVKGYTGDSEVFSFNGIRDFSCFSLANGEVWDLEGLSAEEELAELKRRQDESENAILSLMDMSLMGGM